MRVSNVALLTLAALASQNLTANTSGNPAAPPISPETPQARNFVDGINTTASRGAESISSPETIAHEQFSPNTTASRRAESISEPETIAHEQFSPRIAVKSQTGLLVASAQPELSAAKSQANTPAASGDR